MENQFIVHNESYYARVTSVLRPLSDYSKIPPDVLQRKANIGTDVHKAIHGDIVGDFHMPDVEGMDYFNSFTRWKETLCPTFVASETRYFDDKKRITGCIDALVTIGPQPPVLVDFKTSAQEQPAVWPMQAHLYYYLLTSAGHEVADRFLFIKLDRFGDLPKVYEYKFSDSTLQRCLRMVDDFWSFHQHYLD